MLRWSGRVAPTLLLWVPVVVFGVSDLEWAEFWSRDSSTRTPPPSFLSGAMEPRMKVVQNDVLVRRPQVSHARAGGGQGGQKHLQNGPFRGLGNFVTLYSTLNSVMPSDITIIYLTYLFNTEFILLISTMSIQTIRTLLLQFFFSTRLITLRPLNRRGGATSMRRAAPTKRRPALRLRQHRCAAQRSSPLRCSATPKTDQVGSQAAAAEPLPAG